MQHYSSQVFTDIGKPAGGATITVRPAGSGTNATIYSDDGVTVKSNPFQTNNLGQFDFYAPSGKYDITVTGAQITTYTLPNQVVFDPFEVSSGDTVLTLKGTLVSGSVNPASTGTIRLGSSDSIKFRNNANSADLFGLQKNATDIVQIGDVAGASFTGPISGITNLTLSGTIQNSSPAATMGITVKKGGPSGNYTTTSTGYVNVDATNLVYSVVIPVGWKLSVVATASMFVTTAAVNIGLAIADLAAVPNVVVEYEPLPAATTAVVPVSLAWVQAGDGNTHSYYLQFKTTNASSTAVLQNSGQVIPIMVFTLMPSN